MTMQSGFGTPPNQFEPNFRQGQQDPSAPAGLLPQQLAYILSQMQSGNGDGGASPGMPGGTSGFGSDAQDLSGGPQTSTIGGGVPGTSQQAGTAPGTIDLGGFGRAGLGALGMIGGPVGSLASGIANTGISVNNSLANNSALAAAGLPGYSPVGAVLSDTMFGRAMNSLFGDNTIGNRSGRPDALSELMADRYNQREDTQAGRAQNAANAINEAHVDYSGLGSPANPNPEGYAAGFSPSEVAGLRDSHQGVESLGPAGESVGRDGGNPGGSVGASEGWGGSSGTDHEEGGVAWARGGAIRGYAEGGSPSVPGMPDWLSSLVSTLRLIRDPSSVSAPIGNRTQTPINPASAGFQIPNDRGGAYDSDSGSMRSGGQDASRMTDPSAQRAGGDRLGSIGAGQMPGMDPSAAAPRPDPIAMATAQYLGLSDPRTRQAPGGDQIGGIGPPPGQDSRIKAVAPIGNRVQVPIRQPATNMDPAFEAAAQYLEAQDAPDPTRSMAMEGGPRGAPNMIPAERSMPMPQSAPQRSMPQRAAPRTLSPAEQRERQITAMLNLQQLGGAQGSPAPGDLYARGGRMPGYALGGDLGADMNDNMGGMGQNYGAGSNGTDLGDTGLIGRDPGPALQAILQQAQLSGDPQRIMEVQAAIKSLTKSPSDNNDLTSDPSPYAGGRTGFGGTLTAFASGGRSGFCSQGARGGPRRPFADGGSIGPGSSVPANSFIIPADIPSALGRGNAQMGAQRLRSMGAVPIHGPGDGASDSIVARGPGGAIALSAGEHAMMPEDVAKHGGHKAMSGFVTGARAKEVARLKSMPKPKR